VVDENATLVTQVIATDADMSGSMVFSISGGADAARFSIDASTGALRFNAAPDHESPQDVDADNVYEVVIAVSDGLLSSTQSLVVSVGNVNDNAPVITSHGGALTVSLDVAEGTTAVSTVAAADADAGAVLTYTITGGADAARFVVNASTGELQLASPPDREAPADADRDGVYEVEVSASDGSASDVQAFVVTITDLNDNTPQITSNGGGASVAVSVSENSTAVTTVVADDADVNAVLVYSISGGADAANFTIDAVTGALRFLTAPDRELPTDVGGDHVYEVEVTVSDGTLSDTQRLLVTVLDQDEQPVWITSAADFATRMGQSVVIPVASGPFALVRDPEGGTLQLELVSGPARGTVVLAQDGSVRYTPQSGFVGVDQFAVRASDGALVSDVQWITVRVEATPTGAVVIPPATVTPVEPPRPAPVQGAEATSPGDVRPDDVTEDNAVEPPAGVGAGAGAGVPLGDSVLATGVAVIELDSGTFAPVGQVGPTVALRYSTEMWSWFDRISDASSSASLSPLEVLVQMVQQAVPSGVSTPGPDDVPSAFDLEDLGQWPPASGGAEVAVDVQAMQLGGAALSAGAVWWAARTSGLLASMAVSAPAWRGIDPLPVLGRPRSLEQQPIVEAGDPLARRAEALFDVAPRQVRALTDIDVRR
jgi:hypothetical protein